METPDADVSIKSQTPTKCRKKSIKAEIKNEISTKVVTSLICRSTAENTNTARTAIFVKTPILKCGCYNEVGLSCFSCNVQSSTWSGIKQKPALKVLICWEANAVENPELYECARYFSFPIQSYVNGGFSSGGKLHPFDSCTNARKCILEMMATYRTN